MFEDYIQFLAPVADTFSPVPALTLPLKGRDLQGRLKRNGLSRSWCLLRQRLPCDSHMKNQIFGNRIFFRVSLGLRRPISSPGPGGQFGLTKMHPHLKKEVCP